MGKHLVQVEKEQVEFLFEMQLGKVVIELNKLISKYGEDCFLQDRAGEYEWDNITSYYVAVKELESDEVYQQRIKDIKDNIKFQELKELKRLQEKYLT
jgi:hypothetical protein